MACSEDDGPEVSSQTQRHKAFDSHRIEDKATYTNIPQQTGKHRQSFSYRQRQLFSVVWPFKSGLLQAVDNATRFLSQKDP